MAYSVVIAEDFRMIREIFESAVQGARGYTLASSFMTAEDAVSYLSENEADLVLMDVLFPGSTPSHKNHNSNLNARADIYQPREGYRS